MIRRSLWVLLVACSCTAGPDGPASPAGAGSAARRSPPVAVRPGDIAITDVSVVPMSSDGVLAHHTVVIRGDRIVTVAPSAAVGLRDGITVIDGKGKWLMPGLADMHVHTWYEDDLTMFLAAGVTTVRNMWGVPQHLAWRSQIARGERLGPTIVTAGALIDGDPPDWPGSIVLTGPGDADRLVTEQKAAGYDFLKPVEHLSRAAYEALAAAGKRHGMALCGHVSIAMGLEGVLAAHQRSIEHLDGYLAALVPRGAKLPPIDDYMPWLRAVLSRLDLSRLPGLIDRTIAAGTWNCPTLIVYDRMPELHDVAAIERRVKWLDLMPAAVRASWARDFRASQHTAEDTATLRAFNAQLARIAAALVAANAPILVGTDSGGPYDVPGESLHDEIELLVAAGVPRSRVLRAATADAWRYLGRPREAGVVEVGARADLLLVASNPLSSPLPLVPDGVMVRGRWLPHHELEARLAEIARHSAPPDDPWKDDPPLAAQGKVVHRARYDIATGGTTVGQERLAVGLDAGKRTIVGQVSDFGTRITTSYKLGPDAVTVASTYHTMTLELSGKIAAGKLVVTGTDLTGKAVSLKGPVPAGAFLSGPGIGGSSQLVARLAGMKPGARRTLTSVELGYFPRIAIVSARHEIERKPDRGGHRVFAVATTQAETTVTGELVVDDGATIVGQTFAPPDATTITRRPQ
jgi:hypothetical protein